MSKLEARIARAELAADMSSQAAIEEFRFPQVKCEALIVECPVARRRASHRRIAFRLKRVMYVSGATLGVTAFLESLGGSTLSMMHDMHANVAGPLSTRPREPAPFIQSHM